MKKIKFDYFENGRFAGTMSVDQTYDLVTGWKEDKTPIVDEKKLIDIILSKRPTLKRDKITISLYKC